MKSQNGPSQMKALEDRYSAVLFVMLHEAVLAFEFVNKRHNCHRPTESYSLLFPFLIFYKIKFVFLFVFSSLGIETLRNILKRD